MKYVIIVKDSADTYEIRYMGTPSLMLKIISGVFEHDLWSLLEIDLTELTNKQIIL